MAGLVAEGEELLTKAKGEALALRLPEAAALLTEVIRLLLSSVLLLSLGLNDTTIYEPLILALLGTAEHFC